MVTKAGPLLSSIYISVDETENSNKKFRYRQKLEIGTHFAINFLLSRPIGDLVASAINLGLAERCKKRLQKLPEEQQQKIKTTAKETLGLEDQATYKKFAKKELIASAIRVGLVAATIIATVGLTAAGIAAGLALGSPIVVCILGGVGLIAPSIAVSCLDLKSGAGLADLGATALTYSSAISLNMISVIIYIATRCLMNFDVINEKAVWKETWVDRKAAKLAGI